MKREYQYNFSASNAGKYDILGRERKAMTMVAVLKDHIQKPLQKLHLLNVGGSSGIIDNFLSDYFQSVISVDIDESAIKKATSNFHKNNIEFKIGDALNLEFQDNTFDVVICSHVYEHVPSPEKMMAEIFRVLKPRGVCYFAAGNRIMWNEPHYNLPLLSVIPRPIAHLYIRLTKKADHYHELHYTKWGLKKLVNKFSLFDYTEESIYNPNKYHVEYMVKPGTTKAAIARFVAKYLYFLVPGYIWLLEKPDEEIT